MHELRLVAVSEDGSYAVLVVPGRGGRFSLQIDDRLRAVARGQFSRLAQYEIEVESPLRPKEIQERIRAGETAEEIADAAGVPIERVRWFEGPVLAERAYRAEEAQSAMVRRPGESGPGTRLGDVVGERLTNLGTSTEDAHWDSIKRNDGTWLVQLLFNSAGRAKTAEWLYDPRRKHVTPTDDEAARLCLPEADLPPEPGQSHVGATVTPLQPRFGPPSGQGRRPGGRPADPPQPYQPHPQPAAPPEWPAAHRDPERGNGYGREAEYSPAAHSPAARHSDRTAAYADDAAGYPDELARGESQSAEHVRDTEPSRSAEHETRRSPGAAEYAAPATAREYEPDRTAGREREVDRTAGREREADRTAGREREPDWTAGREHEPDRTAGREHQSDRATGREPDQAPGRGHEADRAAEYGADRTAAHAGGTGGSTVQERPADREDEVSRTAAQEREAAQPAAAHRAEPEPSEPQPEQPAAARRQAPAQQRKPDRGGRGRRERISAQQRRPEPGTEATETEAPAAPAAAAGGQDTPRPAAAQGGRRAAGGRGRRSSVPSWDEIMFGSSRPRD